MAVYYKFKSAKDYDSVPIVGHSISVEHFKQIIFDLKHLGRGTDFDLVVTNAQTNEEYLDEGMLIPRSTSVIVRRVPGLPRQPIVIAPLTEQEGSNVENNYEDVQAVKGSFVGADQSAMKYAEDIEWDDFGNDPYAIPETASVQSINSVQDAPISKEDEESKIKALIETPVLDWQSQPSDGFGPGRGFRRGMDGRAFGRGGFEKKTPPQGYICHRCKVPGHFIQHCPTNGDPNFDIKRVKPPTGIPRSLLIAAPDGSYALPSGAVAVLKPNEAAFEKEMEGMSSTRSIGDLPPELHCPLCKEVMKDAVLTSKCCFTSFCDKCIRDHIISKLMCVCGACNVLADDLLPNKTLRDTINRILESSNNSAESGGSAFHAPDMESRNPQAKVRSPTQSPASKGQEVPAPSTQWEETANIIETVEENKSANVPLKQENRRTPKGSDVSEVKHDLRTIMEAASLGGAPLIDEEVQHKPASGEAGVKKKKEKVQMPSDAAEIQWRTARDIVPKNYMMPSGPSAFSPYWNGIQPRLDGFMPPCGGSMPYVGYGLNPMDIAFGGVYPFGGPGCMLPYCPPQRDLAALATGFNSGPPIMSIAEFEARKADMKRKLEMGRRAERELSKDLEYGREGRSTSNVSSRSKSKSTPPHSGNRLPSRHRSERHSSEHCSRDRDSELPCQSSVKKSGYDQSHHHHSSSRRCSNSASERPPVAATRPSSATGKKQKAGAFSRTGFPDDDDHSVPKKRKLPSASSEGTSSLSNGHHEDHKAASGSRKTVDYDSGDDERHFKRRRPSRYTS